MISQCLLVFLYSKYVYICGLPALNRISIICVCIVVLWSVIKTPVGQNQNFILLYYEYSQEFAAGSLKLQSQFPDTD